MKIFKYFLFALVAALLVSCGGGGGNASNTKDNTGGGTTGASTLSLAIVDKDGKTVSNNSISNGANYYVYSVVKDVTGASVQNALVTFTVSDTSVVTLVSSSALTGSSGAAQVQIRPSGYSSGTAILTASTTVNATVVTASLNLQTAASNVTLGTMAAASSNLSSFQNTAVTVKGYIDGVLAGTGAVSANFTASCGTFSPVTAYSDSTGTITSTYQSGGTCAGAVTLTATPVGSSSSSTTTGVTVETAAASAVNFVGASVPLLVSKSVGGQYSRSRLTFKVIDSGGGAVKTEVLNAVLAPSSIAAGITFEDGTTDPQVLTTIDDGTAGVGVVAGNLFTSVLVTATLKTDATKSATSYGVSVTSGKATQDRISVSAEQLSMEAWNIDGVTNSINVIVSDRLSNPLPKGTLVNFVSNGGVITGKDASGNAARGTCALTELSQCSVTYTSSNGASRPANGRIAILAYMAGEESFVDANGNNMWDAGEIFYPVGRPFIDANESGAFDSGEQRIGISVAGTAACAASGYPSEANTCDASVWSADVLVRRQIIIVQATSEAEIVGVRRTATALLVHISDANANSLQSGIGRNSMPTGSIISAAVTPPTKVTSTTDPVTGVVTKTTETGICTLLALSLDKIGNTTEATDVVVYMEGPDCYNSSIGSAKIAVTVTAPSGTKTGVVF
jgi:hypothetical protein